ncbi:MAG: hypothetical protein ACJASG_001072 [Oleiphilaceae bacterium]|jgi:hypothetical protein
MYCEGINYSLGRGGIKFRQKKSQLKAGKTRVHMKKG